MCFFLSTAPTTTTPTPTHEVREESHKLQSKDWETRAGLRKIFPLIYVVTICIQVS